MRRLRWRFLSAGASLLLLAPALPLAQPASAAPSAKAAPAPLFQATVTRIVVNLSTKAAGSAGWRQARVRDHLKAGDYATTDAKSQATLLFRDGMRLDMNHNTDVIIKDAKDVHLSTGELYERVPAGQGKRNVNTGNAVASVEGTRYDVRVEGNRTILTVIEHKVRFHNKYGSVLVRANQQSVVVGNHAPTPPVTVNASKVVAWAGSAGYSPQLAFPPYYANARIRSAAVSAAMRALHAGGHRAFLAYVHLGQAAADEGHTIQALAFLRQALALESASPAALVDEARTLLVSGQTAAAARLYARAHRLAPMAAAPLAGLGDVALLAGNVDGAVVLYQQAERLAPADAYIPFSLGQALVVQGLYDVALAQEQRALRLSPGLAEAAVALGDVYTLRGQLSVAISAYRRALTADSRLWVAWNDLGYGLDALGRVPDGIAALQHAIVVARTPYQRSLSLESLATELLSLGRIAEALRTAVQATQADATNAQAFVALGDLYDNGTADYARAEAALRAALHLQPHAAAAWATLGDVYFKDGAYRRATAAERQAIAYAPTYIYPRTVLGAIYHALGDERRALEAYRGAVTVAPQSPDAWTAYGVGLINALKEGEGHAALVEALHLVAPGSPSSATTYGYLAAYYLSVPDPARAIAAGRQGVTLNPGDDIALANLAYALVFAGRPREAVPLLKRALAINGHEATYWEFLAQAYRLDGQQGPAMSAAKQAVTLRPRSADAWYELGKERQGAHDLAGAVAAFQRSIALDPHLIGPGAELGKIYYNQKQWARAIAYLKREVALNAGNTVLWAYLGISEFQTAKYDDALVALQRAAADPTDVVSREYIISLYLTRRNYSAALAWSTKLRTLNAAHGEFYLGYTYQLMGGHNAEAVAHFKRALALALRAKDAQIVQGAQSQLGVLAGTK